MQTRTRETYVLFVHLLAFGMERGVEGRKLVCFLVYIYTYIYISYRYIIYILHIYVKKPDVLAFKNHTVSVLGIYAFFPKGYMSSTSKGGQPQRR